jgi:hypothetical protein
LFLKWLVDIQMRSWNRGKLCVPVERWEEHTRHIRPRMPPSVRDLDILLAHGTTRCLRRTGIEFGRMFYRSPELDHLFKRMPNNSTVVQIRYNEDDIGSIMILAPGETTWVVAHCQYPNYGPGTSIVQHKATLKWLNNKRVNSEQQLLEARSQLRKSIEDRRSRQRKVVPRHEIRVLGTSRGMESAQTGSGAKSVGDLETLLTLDRAEILAFEKGERKPLPLAQDPFPDESQPTSGEADPALAAEPGAAGERAGGPADRDNEIAHTDLACPVEPKIRRRFFDE